MSMIELACPGCGELLELDPGFAGGVCRCFSCGTLMAVPQRRGGWAEPVQRPSRPDRPDAPGAGAGATGRGAAGENQRTWVTASGRTIRLSAGREIPTAGKRLKQAVRATTVLLFTGLLAVMVGAAVFAAGVLLRKPANPASIVHGGAGFDAAVNPLNQAKGGFFGLPVDGHTAIVVDVSGVSGPWWGLMQDVLLTTLRSAPAEASVSLVLASDLGPRKFEASGSAAGALAGEYRRFVGQVAAVRTVDLPTAVRQAVALGPRRVVLVSGQPLDGVTVDAIELRMDHLPDASLSVVMIDAHVPGLEDLVRRRGGRYLVVPSEQLRAWHAEAYAAQRKD